MGENNPNYKTGKTRNAEGYIRLSNNGNPILEHVKVMEDYLGRKLDGYETVHHVNGVRDDNRIENLELWSSRHPRGQRVEDLVEWAEEILWRYKK